MFYKRVLLTYIVLVIGTRQNSPK